MLTTLRLQPVCWFVYDLTSDFKQVRVSLISCSRLSGMESVKADPEVKQAAGMAESGDASSKCFKVAYLGSSCMDRRHTQSVQPWVMAEIRRRKEGAREVTLEVLSHCLKATSCDDMGTDALFEHKLQELTRFAKLHQEPRCFAYLSRQQLNSDDFECHVFMAHEPDAVSIFLFSCR